MFHFVPNDGFIVLMISPTFTISVATVLLHQDDVDIKHQRTALPTIQRAPETSNGVCLTKMNLSPPGADLGLN